MWLIACVAISCSIVVITFMIGYAVHLCRRQKRELLLSSNKCILTLSYYHEDEMNHGIPYTSHEPVAVQPHFKTLHSMDAHSIFDENHSHMPLISHYEGEKKSSRNPRRKSFSKTYRKESRHINTPTIVISEVSENKSKVGNKFHEKSKLTYSIFYDEPSKDLHVTVIRATNLPGSKRSDHHTRYFRVRVHVDACSAEWQKTRYVRGTREPEFGETFIVSGLVHNKLRECSLRFHVVEYEEIKNCWSILGEITQTLVDLRANVLLKATKTLHRV